MMCDGIGRHEAAHRTCVVACSKIVQPGFAIAFFAGELVGKKHTLTRIIVHIDQRFVATRVLGPLENESLK